MPQRDQIVVVRNEFAAVAHDGQIDLDMKQWYQSFPERIPLDPICVGLSPYIREPSYSPDERKNKLQNLAAFEEFLFKEFDPERKIQIEIQAFRVDGHVVLLRKVNNPKQGLEGFRKFILDPQKGYAPVFTVEKSSYFGKPISHRQLAVTWKQQADVWIPVFVERFQNDSVDREHQTLTIDWQNVNQSVSHGDFDVFRMTESIPILGIGHLPEGLQQELRDRDTAKRILN